MNKKKQVLAVLGLIFLMALAYAFWATPRQQRVKERRAETTTTRQPRAALQIEAEGETGRLRVDLLQSQAEKFSGYSRNIFRFARIKRPAPPPPKPPPPPPARPKPEVVVEAPPTVESTQVRLRRELARFTFLGFLVKDSTRTIFLTSGGDIFLVKKGDRFGEGGKFLVTDLTGDVLTIRQGDDPRPITVPLVEHAPLSPKS